MEPTTTPGVPQPEPMVLESSPPRNKKRRSPVLPKKADWFVISDQNYEPYSLYSTFCKTMMEKLVGKPLNVTSELWDYVFDHESLDIWADFLPHKGKWTKETFWTSAFSEPPFVNTEANLERLCKTLKNHLKQIQEIAGHLPPTPKKHKDFDEKDMGLIAALPYGVRHSFWKRLAKHNPFRLVPFVLSENKKIVQELQKSEAIAYLQPYYLLANLIQKFKPGHPHDDYHTQAVHLIHNRHATALDFVTLQIEFLDDIMRMNKAAFELVFPSTRQKLIDLEQEKEPKDAEAAASYVTRVNKVLRDIGIKFPNVSQSVGDVEDAKSTLSRLISYGTILQTVLTLNKFYIPGLTENPPGNANIVPSLLTKHNYAPRHAEYKYPYVYIRTGVKGVKVIYYLTNGLKHIIDNDKVDDNTAFVFSCAYMNLDMLRGGHYARDKEVPTLQGFMKMKENMTKRDVEQILPEQAIKPVLVSRLSFHNGTTVNSVLYRASMINLETLPQYFLKYKNIWGERIHENLGSFFVGMGEIVGQRCYPWMINTNLAAVMLHSDLSGVGHSLHELFDETVPDFKTSHFDDNLNATHPFTALPTITFNNVQESTQSNLTLLTQLSEFVFDGTEHGYGIIGLANIIETLSNWTPVGFYFNRERPVCGIYNGYIFFSSVVFGVMQQQYRHLRILAQILGITQTTTSAQLFNIIGFDLDANGPEAAEYGDMVDVSIFTRMRFVASLGGAHPASESYFYEIIHYLQLYYPKAVWKSIGSMLQNIPITEEYIPGTSDPARVFAAPELERRDVTPYPPHAYFRVMKVKQPAARAPYVDQPLPITHITDEGLEYSTTIDAALFAEQVEFFKDPHEMLPHPNDQQGLEVDIFRYTVLSLKRVIKYIRKHFPDGLNAKNCIGKEYLFYGKHTYLQMPHTLDDFLDKHLSQYYYDTVTSDMFMNYYATPIMQGWQRDPESDESVNIWRTRIANKRVPKTLTAYFADIQTGPTDRSKWARVLTENILPMYARYFMIQQGVIQQRFVFTKYLWAHIFTTPAIIPFIVYQKIEADTAKRVTKIQKRGWTKPSETEYKSLIATWVMSKDPANFKTLYKDLVKRYQIVDSILSLHNAPPEVVALYDRFRENKDVAELEQNVPADLVQTYQNMQALADAVQLVTDERMDHMSP